MGVLKSIISTTLKNIVLLFFLIILIVLSVSGLISFLSTSNLLSKENDYINSVSQDADFVINKEKLIIKTQDDKSTFESYFNYLLINERDSLVTSTFYDNEVIKKIDLFSKKTFSVITIQNGKDVFQKKYTYVDPNNSQDGFITLAGEEYEVFLNNNFFFDESLNSYTLTRAEASSLSYHLTKLLVKARNFFLFNYIKNLGKKYLFNINYLPSEVFNAKITRNNMDKNIFMRMFFANKSNAALNSPYNLSLIEGKYPGYDIDDKYLQATTYDYSINEVNPLQVCLNIQDDLLRLECENSLKTQIVINENFAKTNNLKIGDHFWINSIYVTIVGIGISKIVSFPYIMPLYPVPNSSINGVFWLYDDDITDGVLTVNVIGNRSLKYEKGIFKEDTIYAKFNNALTQEEKQISIKLINEDLKTILSKIVSDQYLFSRNDPQFIGKIRVDALKSISFAFQIFGISFSVILILVMMLISFLSIKSLISQTRDRLAIMKAIGYSRYFIVFVYSFVPILVCIISSICGYFLGIYFTNIFLNLIRPIMLNYVTFIKIDWLILTISILVPFFSLVITTILTTAIHIKEKASESLKLHDNKRPSTIYRFFKKIFPTLIRKSRIQLSFFLSSFGKIIVLSLLVFVSTSVIFTATIVSQVSKDYSENYLIGKNYKSIVYYRTPIWNLPTTRYTLGLEQNEVYNPLDLDKLQNSLSSTSSLTDINMIFDEILKGTWFKDSYMSVDMAKKLDELDYPDTTIGSTSFSYDTVKDLICGAVLGQKWETVDKKTYSISKCLIYIFTSNVPAYLQDRVGENLSYPFSFTRVDFEPNKEELFTWAKVQLYKASKSLLTINNNEVVGDAKIIGLANDQSKVKLISKDGEDLFLKLKSYWYDSLSNQKSAIPIVINQTIAGKYNIKKGDYLKIDTFREEFVNLNTNQPVYGVIHDQSGKIIKTAGEIIHGDPYAPDGQLYNYYFEDQAQDLEEVVLVENGGISTLGWTSTGQFKNGVRNGIYGIVKKRDRENDNSKSYYVLGVTPNLDLNDNLVYTMQSYVNENLHYPNSIDKGENYLWFNGKFSDSVETTSDLFKNQSCITQTYGIFSRNSITTEYYNNPILPCITDATFNTLVVSAIYSLSSSLNIFLYTILLLFSLLNIIVVYIINSIAIKSMKKIIIIMRAIGYKAGRILWTFSLTYIPSIIFVISATLALLYWIFNDYIHDFLINNAIDLPINLRWWYYLVSGGFIFFLFIIIFFINFATSLKTISKKEK